MKKIILSLIMTALSGSLVASEKTITLYKDGEIYDQQGKVVSNETLKIDVPISSSVSQTFDISFKVNKFKIESLDSYQKDNVKVDVIEIDFIEIDFIDDEIEDYYHISYEDFGLKWNYSYNVYVNEKETLIETNVVIKNFTDVTYKEININVIPLNYEEFEASDKSYEESIFAKFEAVNLPANTTVNFVASSQIIESHLVDFDNRSFINMPKEMANSDFVNFYRGNKNN
jgi:hypothetical protein